MVTFLPLFRYLKYTMYGVFFFHTRRSGEIEDQRLIQLAEVGKQGTKSLCFSGVFAWTGKSDPNEAVQQFNRKRIRNHRVKELVSKKSAANLKRIVTQRILSIPMSVLVF